MSSSASTLGSWTARARRRALDLGFHAVGFAAAQPSPTEDHARLVAFLRAGMHGEMAYLARYVEARRDVDSPAILAGARTVICVSWRYDRSAGSLRADPPICQRVARYARGRDYHRHVRRRLDQLASYVRSLGGDARAFCDTAPLLERAWARRAGLGFVGRNGMLIVPGQGSYCVLGEVVTTLSLPIESAVAASTPALPADCGSCLRCVEACPTGALQHPYVMDPRRCLSYATIEASGEPPRKLWAAMSERLFGCDACQEACPHNDVPAVAADQTAAFRPLARWGRVELADLVALGPHEWSQLTAGSPVRRAGRGGLARNAALVAWGLARCGDLAARRVVAAAAQHDDPGVGRFAQALLRELSV